MPKAVLHPRLVADIEVVLATTLESFGVNQYQRYEAAIQDALDHVIAYPEEGVLYSPRPRFRTFHIGKTGRRARHRLVYCVEADGLVIVLRLLHDRMDVGRHLPED